MYELKDGIVCIPATALYKDLKIISYSMYRNVEFRKKLNFVQRGGNGRVALIAFDSLPPDIKRQVVDKIGEPPAKERFCSVETFFKEDAKTRHFFESYKLPDGRYLKAEDQDEYTANVTMLLALEAAVNETKMTRRARSGSKGVDWRALTKTVISLKYKKVGDEFPYKHTLPTNERRLREALTRLQNEGFESVIRLGKYKNKNGAKVKTDEQERLLQEMIANGRNLDNEIIADMYNTAAKVIGWETITGAAVGVWRKKMKRITEAGRRGIRQYNNTFSMQHKRSRPTAPLFFWSADGWKAELLYKKRGFDTASKCNLTKYIYRLTVEVILDAYNYYPIGYAIGDSENSDLMTAAMRNAINHTRELFGQRYRTWQIQSDKFNDKGMKQYWEALGDKWTPARVGNAKAKPIEAWFKHEMQKRCQTSFDYPNWSGYGVTAKTDSQVNDDWLNANKKNIPDRDGCFEQLTKIMESIRAEKRAEFVAAFNALPQEDKLPISDELYLYKFGHKTKPNRMEGQGLTPSIGGVEHFYDCFDLNFRNHYNERWIMYYDPDDKSKALAVAEGKEELRFMVEQKYIQPMALKDRKEGDAEALARVNSYNRIDQDYVTEERRVGTEMVRQLFACHKELNDGLLEKLLITDSRGQHKKYTYQEAAKEVDFEHVDTSSMRESDYLKNKINFSDYIK